METAEHYNIVSLNYIVSSDGHLAAMALGDGQ